MFDKAQNYARRGFVTLKHHAKEAYKHGRNFMSKMDYGYQVLKKVHNVLTPASSGLVSTHTLTFVHGVAPFK